MQDYETISLQLSNLIQHVSPSLPILKHVIEKNNLNENEKFILNQLYDFQETLKSVD